MKTEEKTEETLYSLREIVERLNELDPLLRVTYDRINGYATLPEVRSFCCAQDIPGVKGVRYPAESLDRFLLIMRAANQKLVTPATVGAFLERTEEGGGGELVPASQTRAQNALVPVVRDLGEDALSVGREIAQAITERTDPQDVVYTSDKAAQFLACSVDSLRKYFAPSFRIGRSPRWRRSDLLKGPKS